MKFDFYNKRREKLSGILEQPEGEAKAYALFAHCFTCTKDIIATSVISKALMAKGIGVLRFDFTGLGSSQGDFSETNFSSNVQDLLSACKELEVKFKHPEILIGHSLGGAAVLKAANELDKVKAVITIGSPSDASHVSHLFGKNLEKIEKDGKAEVDLAGRNFTIKKQFLDDIESVEILPDIAKLNKALLVMHSPVDKTVPIEHASKIFMSARHPKSFISLNKADHLLLNRKDANYVAQIIAAWTMEYIVN